MKDKLSTLLQDIYAWLLPWWFLIRHGELEEIVKSVDANVVSEVSIVNRFGEEVGYWAYGFYAPSYLYKKSALDFPYTGQEGIRFKNKS